MTDLLDGNVLVSMVVNEHVHHAATQRWWSDSTSAVATCPITQGTLVRFLMRTGTSSATAIIALREIVALPEHELWADDLDYTAVDLRGVIGHRQVTDAYLAALARHRGGRLVTLDRGLAALHPDVSVLVPVES